MRERFTSGKSQNFMVLLAGLLVSLFAGILITTAPVLAADVTWNAGKLVMNSESYSLFADDEAIDTMGIPENSQVYVTQFDRSAPGQTVKVLYFGPGEQPDVTTSITSLEFSFSPPDTWQQTGSSTVSVDNAQAQPSIDAQCGIPSIGWFVCGPTMFIANGMDWIYTQLTAFLEVRPMEINNTTSSFYQAWSVMRDIANVAFVIAFLIIVYSHVSNLGVSAYGVKKMAPRLVVAALLVNASFLICTVVVDLSNVTGYAVKDVFDNLFDQMTRTSTANNAGIGSTSDIVQTFLTGGTLLLAGGAATGASLLAATPFLVPLLATLFVALLIALLVMAARQALIVILTLIAPLAFVCYLLPGTEKWFGKWRDTFFTMLIFFPAFSFVFGASQLAGALITSNAQSTVIFILGMAVQLAPLAITPLILKLGGGLLNRFAGIVNDPTKGLVDKSKQWAQNASKDIANRRTYGNENLKGWNLARRAARYGDRRSRLLKDRLAESDLRAENSYRDWEKHKQQDIKKRDADNDKQIIDERLNKSWSGAVLSDERRSDRDMLRHSLKDQSEALSKRVDARYEDFKAGSDGHIGHGNMAALQRATMKAQEDAFGTDQRMAMAKASQSERVAEKMKDERTMAVNDIGVTVSYRDYAGGVLGDSGAAAALANAIASRDKAHREGVQEQMVIQEHFKLTGEERQRLSWGRDVEINDERGNYKFSGSDASIKEAATIRQMEIGTFKHKMSAILGTNVANIADQTTDSATGRPAALTGETHEIRAAVSEAAAKNSIAKTAVWLGGKGIEDVNQGRFTIDEAVIQTLAGGKVKEFDLSHNDVDALKIMFEFDKGAVPDDKMADFEAGMRSLRESAWRIVNSSELRANASKAAIEVFDKWKIEPGSDTSENAE